MSIEKGPGHQIPEQKSEQVDFEKIWTEIEQEVKEFYKKYVTERFKKMKTELSPERLKKYIDKCAESDKRFLTWVMDEAKRMHAETPNAEHKILFDIDDTIAEPKYGDEEEKIPLSTLPIGTYVRPIVKTVFENIQKLYPKTKIGIITTRPREILTQNLGEKEHLAQIDPYIDRESIFTTETSELKPPFTFEEVKKHLGTMPIERNDKDMELLAATLSMGDEIQKLDVLKNLRSDQSNTELMVVDNARFPNHLKYGVSLTRELPNALFPHV